MNGNVRFAAILIGVAACVLIGLSGADMNQDFSTGGAIFFLFLIVLLVNPVLSLCVQRWKLSSGELVFIYGMMICASTTVMCHGVYFPSIVSAPVYFADAQNRWEEAIVDHLSPWFFLLDKDAVRGFYEGGGRDFRIPWAAWVKPVAVWLSFFLVLSFVMLCIMIVLRKQWEERERLAYPLVQLPLVLAETSTGSAFPPVFRSFLFWAGFALVFLLGNLNGLHNHFVRIPQVIPVFSAPTIRLFGESVRLIFRVSFVMIAFSYLVNTRVSFSVWFLYLLTMVVRGIFNVTGYANVFAEPMDVYSYVNGGPFFSHFQTGALVMLVLAGLWRARSHLRDFFLGRLDSSEDEILSPRTVRWGLALGMVFLLGWLWFSGLALWVGAFFLAVTILLFVGITRVVVQAGIAETKTPISPFTAVMSGVGTANLPAHSMVSLGTGYIWAADTRSMTIAADAHALKLWGTAMSQSRRSYGRRFALALVAAVALAFLAYVVPRIVYGYRNGFLNAVYQPDIKDSFDYITRGVLHPTGPFWLGWAVTASGALVLLAFSFLTERFLWWPLHPLGVPIAAIWLTEQVWFSVFLAWLIKAVGLKYLGGTAYKKSVPFFLGMILGQFSAVGVWFLIDTLQGGPVHTIFWL